MVVSEFPAPAKCRTSISEAQGTFWKSGEERSYRSAVGEVLRQIESSISDRTAAHVNIQHLSLPAEDLQMIKPVSIPA